MRNIHQSGDNGWRSFFQSFTNQSAGEVSFFGVVVLLFATDAFSERGILPLRTMPVRQFLCDRFDEIAAS